MQIRISISFLKLVCRVFAKEPEYIQCDKNNQQAQLTVNTKILATFNFDLHLIYLL